MKEKETVSVTMAGEDYLEAVLMIRNQKGTVRSVDLAQKMQVSKPSVSVMVHALMDAGLLYMDETKSLHFTDAGLRIAENIYEKHRFLTKALILLGIDPALAEADACRMEHHVSDDTFSVIKAYCGECVSVC